MSASRCRECRKLIRDCSVIRMPAFANGPEWAGWQWVKRMQMVGRSTPMRFLMIDEDGLLSSDHFYGDDEVIDMDLGSPEAALKVANAIAEADGGWSTDHIDWSEAELVP